MRGPYTFSNSRDFASRELFFRIADGDDSAVAYCYSELNARTICQILNRDWIESVLKPLKISLAGVRLNGRAAKTAKPKTGGTQKRRAAKRDKGTGDARAVAGSTPAPGFSPGTEARALFAERCSKVKLRNVRLY